MSHSPSQPSHPAAHELVSVAYRTVTSPFSFIHQDVVSATYYTLRVAWSLLQCQELVLRGLYWVSEALKTECLQILEKRYTMATRLTCLQKQEMKTRLLYETVVGDCEAPEVKGLAEIKPRLQSVADHLSRCSHSVSEHQAIVWCLLSDVEKRRSQMKDDRSIQKMEACLDKMQLIYSQFRKARKCPRLLYNEQQIHKLDKVNLGHLAKKVLSIFQNDCAQQYQAALLAHGTRMRKVFEMRKHLKKLNRSLTACTVEMSGCQDDLYNVLGELPQRVLQDKMTTAPSSQGYLKQKHQAMMFGMQELQEQMKIVANNLQLNNNIIQRLNGFASAPDL